jgi:hypothetical protein
MVTARKNNKISYRLFLTLTQQGQFNLKSDAQYIKVAMVTDTHTQKNQMLRRVHKNRVAFLTAF